MGHGGNIISDNFRAFSGGALGSFLFFFKPILLDGAIGHKETFVMWIAIMALKLFGISVISFTSGLATAIGADIYKNYIQYKLFKKKQNDKSKRKSDTGRDDQAAA